jgi:hypothetical protein
LGLWGCGQHFCVVHKSTGLRARRISALRSLLDTR